MMGREREILVTRMARPDRYCGYDIDGYCTLQATKVSWVFEISRDGQQLFTLITVISKPELISRGLESEAEVIEEVKGEGLTFPRKSGHENKRIRV